MQYSCRLTITKAVRDWHVEEQTERELSQQDFATQKPCRMLQYYKDQMIHWQHKKTEASGSSEKDIATNYPQYDRD